MICWVVGLVGLLFGGGSAAPVDKTNAGFYGGTSVVELTLDTLADLNRTTKNVSPIHQSDLQWPSPPCPIPPSPPPPPPSPIPPPQPPPWPLRWDPQRPCGRHAMPWPPPLAGHGGRRGYVVVSLYSHCLLHL